MPGPTAQSLVRNLGRRLQEFVLATPSGGTQTTLIDQRLQQYFPQDIAQLFAWVSAVPGADAQNVGLEFRASSWTFSNFTLTLFAPGYPTNISGGPYEIHMRYQRSLILEMINDAVGQLGLTWYRETRDDTLVTVQPGWRYQLPNNQNWTEVTRIEIQINTDPISTAAGYPFASADYLNPRVERRVDQVGNEFWEIQFGLQPPPGRILRVFGESFYTDLVLDSDYLPLAGMWLRPALSWIYARATFSLQDATNNRQPTTALETARQKALDALERQKNEILANAPAHKPGKIITPGRGDGYPVESPNDWKYLGSFKSATFVRGGS